MSQSAPSKHFPHGISIFALHLTRLCRALHNPIKLTGATRWLQEPQYQEVVQFRYAGSP